MSHLADQKAELRAAILERLQQMNDRSREAESRSVVRRILDVLPVDSAVCAYMPMRTEPDIRPLLTEILARRQPLFLPSFDGSNLVMRRVHDLQHLPVSAFGIPEPAADAALLDQNVPVVALVPGRAFAADGGRLGRGNGGYDRWIAEHKKTNASATSLPSGERPSEGLSPKKSYYYGVAFDCQIVSAVPMEEHDAFVDGIFTPRGFLTAQK